jgi:hypothetical protein
MRNSTGAFYLSREVDSVVVSQPAFKSYHERFSCVARATSSVAGWGISISVAKRVLWWCPSQPSKATTRGLVVLHMLHHPSLAGAFLSQLRSGFCGGVSASLQKSHWRTFVAMHPRGWTTGAGSKRRDRYRSSSIAKARHLPAKNREDRSATGRP